MSGDGKELTIPEFHLEDAEISKKMNLELTKDDVIAYKVSIVEDRLEEEKKEKDKELKAKQKVISKLEEEFKDAVDAFAEKEVGEEVKAVNDAFKKLGIKKTLKISACIDEEKKKKLVSISVKLGKDDDGYYSGTFTEDVRKVAFNQDLKDVEKKLDDARDEGNVLINRIAEIRNILANMGRLERKAKAKVVEEILKKDSAVRKLLAEKDKK